MHQTSSVMCQHDARLGYRPILASSILPNFLTHDADAWCKRALKRLMQSIDGLLI